MPRFIQPVAGGVDIDVSRETWQLGPSLSINHDARGRPILNARTEVLFPVADSYLGFPGAVFDGTTDDGPAFNRAIAACQVNGGGKVYAPEAVYLTTVPIVVSGKGVQLWGGGKWNTTILGATGMTGPIGYLLGSDASNRCGIFDIGFQSQAHLTNTPSGIKPPGVGIIGLRIETSFNARLEYVRVEDCDIGFDAYGMLYTGTLECDAYGCTIALQMSDITIGAGDPYGRLGLYPCQFFEWKGGKMWGTGTATTNFTQAIKSTSGGSNMMFRDINVSGIHSGSSACMEFTNVGPVGFNPGVLMEYGYFEANTSSVAEFSVSGNIFSPSEVSSCFFGSNTGMACSALCIAGPLYIWNSQGFPLAGSDPNFVYQAGTQGVIISSGATTWSIDPGANVAQLTPFGFVNSSSGGALIAPGGAEAFQITAGTADDGWMAIYPRTSSPSTRGLLFGYVGAASIDVVLRNDLSGGHVQIQGGGGGGSGWTNYPSGDWLPDGDATQNAGSSSHHIKEVILSDGVKVGGNNVVRARGAAVTDPTGGATIDTQCRAALIALLDRLGDTAGHGLITR